MFNKITVLLTSNYFSKLYYGSEIWQIPKLNVNSKKQLLSASANAMKLCERHYNPEISYVDLHKKYERALPNDFCMYRHCLMLFKIFNYMIPEYDWLDLNIQMINTRRQKFFEVQNHSVYKVGNNILSNRLSCLNKKIELDMLNLPFNSYKILCKKMFLSWILPFIFHYVLSIIMYVCIEEGTNKLILKSHQKSKDKRWNVKKTRVWGVK